MWNCNGTTAFIEYVLSNGKGANTFFIKTNCYMLNNQLNTSSAAQLSGTGTSAHETGIIGSSLSLNSNALRSYTPAGTRRRKASSTSGMRAALCETLIALHPGIRRIKIKDFGILFSARIWMRSGRIIHRTAYSLQNLAGLLAEGVCAMEKGGEA